MQTEASVIADGIAEEMGQYPDLARLSTQRLIADIQAKFVVPWNTAFHAVNRFRESLRRAADGC